jgi:hypothetical protein
MVEKIHKNFKLGVSEKNFYFAKEFYAPQFDETKQTAYLNIHALQKYRDVPIILIITKIRMRHLYQLLKNFFEEEEFEYG